MMFERQTEVRLGGCREQLKELGLGGRGNELVAVAFQELIEQDLNQALLV